MLPGWYGLGSALKKKKNQEILQQMYENWDFFRAQLSNVDMLLAKTDMDIASEYIKLAKDQKLVRYLENIKELDLTKKLVLKISGKNKITRR